jgi:hypothetical protein
MSPPGILLSHNNFIKNTGVFFANYKTIITPNTVNIVNISSRRKIIKKEVILTEKIEEMRIKEMRIKGHLYLIYQH